MLNIIPVNISMCTVLYSLSLVVQHNITKTKAEDLKLLYKLCYESSISVTSMVIKKGLRSFSGWSFTEDSDEFEKRVSQLER